MSNSRIIGRRAAAQGGPSSVPGFLLWHVTLRWRSLVAAALAPLDLTPTQFFLLGSLTWLSRSGAPTQRALADHAGLDPMMTSQLARALAKRGLLSRRDDPHDTRAFRLRLTSDGTRLARRAAAVVRQIDADFFAALGSDGEPFQWMLRRLAIASGASAALVGEPEVGAG